MALFSPPISSSLQNPNLISKISSSLLSTKRFSLISVPRASSDNGTTSPASASVSATTTVVEIPKPVAVAVEEVPVKSPESSSASGNGAVGGEETDLGTAATVIKFEDAKWVNGTWDLKQFEKDGKTDWDSVIVSG